MKNPSQIQDLINYDELYYNSGTSPISDIKYDLLRHIAKKHFPNHSYFTEVGSPIKLKNKKIKLPYVLGSLNKVKTDDQLNKWYNRNEVYVVSEKLDGISIYVKYIDNILVQAATRGDGTIGHDITEKAKLFCPTPKNNVGILEVRGEVLIFGNLYEQLGKKNRRNCVAGLLNQKGNENCEFLNVKFYELINSSNLTPYERCFEEKRLKKLFSNFGKDNLPKVKIFSPGTLTVKSLTNKLNIWKDECKNVYDIDGIVITLGISERENDYYPKNKIAFKVDEEGKITKVIGCEWETSRTGRVKPVLKIDPVETQGVTIKNVTGFNYKFIKDNQIGIGTKIKIVRAGDIIPHITDIINSEGTKTFQITRCPTCRYDLKEIGVELICDNSQCASRLIRQISYFFLNLDVEYFSEKTIEKLMKHLNLLNIESFYYLTARDMARLTGFGDKKIKKIISEIKKTLNCKPEMLLAAFGIDGIGIESSKTLLKRYSFDELFGLKSISEIDGFGDITSEKFVNGMKRNISLYQMLVSKGLKFVKKEKKNLILKDKIIALTGKGKMGRKEYKTKIESLGGSVKGMTKNTNFLVTSDVDFTSGKSEKAKELGILIISYDELEKMMS